MSSLEQIAALMRDVAVADVFVGGIIDHEAEPKEFVRLMGCVYLRLGDTLLCCREEKQQLQIRLNIVEHIDMAYSAEQSSTLEQYEFCIMSMSSLLLNNGYPEHIICRLRCFADVHSDPTSAMFRCIAFEFEGGDVIFMDPAHTLGISVGGKDQLLTWLTSLVETDCYEISVPPNTPPRLA
jgi:hypothetical protein